MICGVSFHSSVFVICIWVFCDGARVGKLFRARNTSKRWISSGSVFCISWESTFSFSNRLRARLLSLGIAWCSGLGSLLNRHSGRLAAATSVYVTSFVSKQWRIKSIDFYPFSIYSTFAGRVKRWKRFMVQSSYLGDIATASCILSEISLAVVSLLLYKTNLLVQITKQTLANYLNRHRASTSIGGSPSSARGFEDNVALHVWRVVSSSL